jgi:hypothetical protein
MIACVLEVKKEIPIEVKREFPVDISNEIN